MSNGMKALMGSPAFIKNNEDDRLFAALRKQVNDALVSNQVPEFNLSVLKAFILPAIFVGLYVAAMLSSSIRVFFAFYAGMGFMVVIMFVNLIHEACHNNLFKVKKWNQRYMFLFDLLGANSFIWRKRHVRLHHSYPNVVGWDSDIEKSEFLKVHPRDQSKKLIKQQGFMFLIYPFFVTNWFLIRDFKDYFSKKTIVRKLGSIPLKEYYKLFLFKFIFIGYIIGLPDLITPFSVSQILGAFFIYFLATGIMGLMVLLPPHVNIYNEFNVVNEGGTLDRSWFRLQLYSTNDVSGNNWFYRVVMGNFNFHLAHHLFPNISYLQAPLVTKVIRDFCLQHELPYRSYPLGVAIFGHIKLILKNRGMIDLFEEDM
jgi:linoleoyl-CoA desaturase